MSWSVLFSVIAVVCGIIILSFGIGNNDKLSLVCGSAIIALQIVSLMGKLSW